MFAFGLSFTIIEKLLCSFFVLVLETEIKTELNIGSKIRTELYRIESNQIVSLISVLIFKNFWLRHWSHASAQDQEVRKVSKNIVSTGTIISIS